MPAQALAGWLAQQPQRTKGEFALVLHPAPVTLDAGSDLKVLKLLLPELPLKSAVRLAADITGQPRNALYEAALALKKPGNGGPADEGD